VASELPARLQTDERRLRQILLNLLANAVRFTDRGWVGLFVVACRGTHVRFEVCDSGIGMSAEQLGKLFQPFTQLDAARSGGGTGLGLVISRNLVRMMGGELQVRSSPESGSTFWFELEVKTPGTHRGKADPEALVCGYAGPRKSVLIVDDIPESRAVLVQLLEPLGFAVLQATNGGEALTIAQATRPDLVLTDLVMPEMDGRELTRRLRGRPELASVPIIVASAAASARGELEWRELGADAFLAKPIRAEELLVEIERMLEIKWVYDVGG
jgi:CheY-like chemotaxis protein